MLSFAESSAFVPFCFVPALQWKALQESDLAAQAKAKVTPYYEQAAAKVSPYYEQAMEASKPAREAAAVFYQKAKVRLGFALRCSVWCGLVGEQHVLHNSTSACSGSGPLCILTPALEECRAACAQSNYPLMA